MKKNLAKKSRKKFYEKQLEIFLTSLFLTIPACTYASSPSLDIPLQRRQIPSAMALTYSTNLALGTPAPDFSLPDADGTIVRLKDFKDASALLVMFICNHCPYVQHVRHAVADLAREYQKKGVAVIAINSNDVTKYPADNPNMMKEESKLVGYTFPYLIDENQAVAKAYYAACTPEFYVFDKQRKLTYHGRLDSSTPGNGTKTTGEDLRAALDATLAGKPASPVQKPSMGCNIKWKPGNEPEYAR